MKYQPIYFDLHELVCEHVYKHFGYFAWSFLDDRTLRVLDVIRQKLNKPVYVNNWDINGQFSQRGLRCLKCDLIRKAAVEGRMYFSPHLRGVAYDFDVQGMVAEEVRVWIEKNHLIIPFPVRLEDTVSWVHLDTAVLDETRKVIRINP